jgi:hypothetical protein
VPVTHRTDNSGVRSSKPRQPLILAPVRAYIASTQTAATANETAGVGKANVIGPAIPANLNGMRAVMIGAIDQQAAHAGFAHFTEGDLLGPLLHGP